MKKKHRLKNSLTFLEGMEEKKSETEQNQTEKRRIKAKIIPGQRERLETKERGTTK